MSVREVLWKTVGDHEDKRIDQQQKRSKHYVRFGRSPVDIDEYFYDDDNDDDARQSAYIPRPSARRHYVRFGRASGGRHYIRFGRNSGAGTTAKRASRHYVRFGRDQQNADEKRAHYVRFGRGVDDGSDDDPLSAADKRPNYVRFG